MTFGAPPGTTRVDELVIAARTNAFPEQRSTPRRVEVTIDDPIPPSISLGGPLASGLWVSGRAGRPHVSVASADNAGIQSVVAMIGDKE